MSLLFSITIILIMLLGQYEGIFKKKKLPGYWVTLPAIRSFDMKIL